MLKIKDPRDIRFYLYVSDAKVDMLFEQMFEAAKRSSRRELKAKVGPVEGSIERSTEDNNPSRDDKVRAIEQELTDQNLVGTPQDPKAYFKGILPMRWGLYDDQQTRPPGFPALVYFGGVDPNVPLIVGLGGSSTHVMGHAGATSTYSRSSTPTLAKWLVRGLIGEEEIIREKRGLIPGVDSDLYEAVAIALHYLRPPTQQLAFLAKTLAVGKSYGLEHMTGFSETSVVLGTPVYVHQTHVLPEGGGYGLDDEWKQHFERGR